jgi:pimeloyl-ACP methyl ester carboxylesterase
MLPMAEPTLTATRLAGSPHAAALLVVGPSLGTAVEDLWGAAAAALADRFEVVGWDLPGHGRSKPADQPFTVGDLACAVRRLAVAAAAGRLAFHAGVSLAGAVSLDLALEPGPFTAVACLAGAATFGDPAAWHDRAALVRRAGTPVMVAGSSQRWFAAGFVDREPGVANRLLLSLTDTDSDSYALACEALAGFDLRERLSAARVPVLVAPGELDVVIAPSLAAETTADRIPRPTWHVFTGCGHLPPAEDPAAVATVLASTFSPGGNR